MMDRIADHSMPVYRHGHCIAQHREQGCIKCRAETLDIALRTSATARMTSASASRVSEGLDPGSVAISRSACRCALGRALPAPFRCTQATCDAALILTACHACRTALAMLSLILLSRNAFRVFSRLPTIIFLYQGTPHICAWPPGWLGCVLKPQPAAQAMRQREFSAHTCAQHKSLSSYQCPAARINLTRGYALFLSSLSALDDLWGS